MKEPLITILLTTYNRADLIGETLSSIISQTYTNWECIIIDDNSTDNTESFLYDNYISQDKRFSFYQKDLSKYKKGLGGSRNQSLDIAESRNALYIQFFDDDDLMHPQKLKLQMKPFINDGNLDMTLCMFRKFDRLSVVNLNLETCDDSLCNIFSKDLFWDFLYSKINLNSLGPIWRFSAIKDIRFDESLITGEEKDFYLRIFFKKNINYHPVNFVLFWYRKHNKTITKGSFNDNKKYENSLNKVRRKTYKMIFFSNKVSFMIRVKFLIKFLIK